ncbi:hypothetical protein ON010_g6945 [Phytophthora cinnamomi]|nr:hypothetical protein ON010_g6945 [Phytophthora cinnamomi]
MSQIPRRNSTNSSFSAVAKTDAAPAPVKTESASERPARGHAEVRSDRKATTEGAPQRTPQADIVKRASLRMPSRLSERGETPRPNASTVAGPGETLSTFRPFVNANILEDFDEKFSLAIRIRWLEKFQSIAVQGGRTDKVKIYEMKLKLSAAVRNWRSNLGTKERRD